MPNWCSNTLHIVGPDPDIDNFVNGLGVYNDDQKGISILETYYPTPDILRGTVASSSPTPAEQAHRDQAKAETGYSDWYDWCCANWGTKWGDCDTTMTGNPDDGEVKFRFDTAWSPPVEGIQAISAKFPALTFDLAWCEPGMEFAGGASFRGGSQVAQIDMPFPQYSGDSDDLEAYNDFYSEEIADLPGMILDLLADARQVA